jgi:DNA ligase-1
MVFEIGFEGIAASGRHKAGIAVRFPRILRRREDKPSGGRYPGFAEGLLAAP